MKFESKDLYYIFWKELTRHLCLDAVIFFKYKYIWVINKINPNFNLNNNISLICDYKPIRNIEKYMTEYK